MNPFQLLVEKAMNEQGIKVPQSMSSVVSPSSQGFQQDGSTLKIGDQISLYMDDTNAGVVFLSASGITSTTARVSGVETGKNQTPSNFKVHVHNQYAAFAEYSRILDTMGSRKDASKFDLGGKKKPTLGRTNTMKGSFTSLNTLRNNLPTDMEITKRVSDEHLDDELRQLEVKFEREREQNKIEAERSIGKEVLYGHAIQLQHLKSKKFLTITRESAELQKDCVKLTLDAYGNANSVFYVMPYYKFRTEGQKVIINDQIRLWNRKSNQHIHLSDAKFQDKRREVNMSSSVSSTKWRIRLFTDFIKPDVAKRFLKAGDVIRLYHQTSEGYLDVDLEKSNTVKIRLDKDKEAKLSSNTMWEVELFDPSRGGVLNWQNCYRLRHVATNRYLNVRLPMDSDSDNDSDDDIASPLDTDILAEKKPDSKTGDSRVPKLPLKFKFAASSNDDSGEVLSPRHINHAERMKDQRTRLNSELQSVSQTSGTRANPITSKWNILRKKIMTDTKTSTPTNQILPKTYDLFVDDPSASSTLFTIHAPNASEGQIALDSYLRIQHHHTQSWLHCNSFRPSITASAATSSIIGSLYAVAHAQSEASFRQRRRKLYEMSYSKIEASTTLREEDVFTIKLVSQENIEDLLFIQTAIASLDVMRGKLKKKQRISKSDVHKVSSTLQELCIFCTDSRETDVMKREGIPFANRQNYLREQLVLHKVMDIIRFMFEHDYIDVDDLTDEKFIAEKDLIKYAYRFVKQAVKSNKSNGLHMATYIGFIQTQIHLSGIGGINVADSLIEILHSGNYELLNNINREEVQFFVDRLIEMDRNPYLLSFLNALMCTVNDRAVVKNQDLIRALLFNSETAKQKLLIPYMHENKMMISVDGTEEGLQQFVDLCNTKGSRAKYGLSMLEFFENSIELFSRLCMGRNSNSIDLISKLMSLDLVMRCISENLPPKTRSSFCNLLLNCYVDRAPYERRPLVKLTRNWHKDKTPKEKKKKDTLMVKMESVRTFIVKFFDSNCKLEKRDRGLNSFILVLIRCTKAMLEFRIFENIEDISTLMANLYKVLDGKTDLSDKKLMNDKDRYAEDEENAVLTSIKIEICKIFNIFIDISMNRRTSYFVNAFKHRASNELFSFGEPDQERQDQAIIDKLFAYEKNTPPSTMLASPDFKLRFFQTLLDLQNYENPVLANSALNLLYRMHHQKEELSELLLRLELLVSRQMVRSYNELNTNTSKLRQLLSGDAATRLQGVETQRVQDLISNIVTDARANGQRAQRILRNIKAHKIAIESLKRTFYDPETQRLVWQSCTKLLIEFVRANAENQQLLFRDLSLFIERLQVPDMALLLAEMVKNNRSLCTSIEERHVRSYVDTMAEQEDLSARYLSFLRCVVLPEGKPLKRNQVYVVKCLMERKKDIIVLFSDKRGLRERDKRVSRNEHIEEPDGILNYHIELLQLLCDCAEGKNHVAEVKLQSLLGMDTIIDQLTDSVLIPTLRNPLTRFLNEVYINTERDSLKYSIQTNEKLWRLFDKMNTELEYFMKKRVRPTVVELDRAPTQTEVIDLAESTSPAAQNEEVETKPVTSISAIDNHYVYRLLIPLLREYFFKYYPPPNLMEHHEKISQQIIVNLTTLYTKTANPYHREAIKRCAQAMFKKTLKSSNKAIDEFFRKLMVDTSKPCEFIREARQKLDEKDELLCNQFMSYIKRFVPQLHARSDLVNAPSLYENEHSLNRLILVLRRITQEGYDEYTKFATIHALRTLQALLRNVIETDDNERIEKMLLLLVRVNTPQMMVDLVCCPVDDIVKEALHLGILLLHEGNQTVQRNLLEIFVQTDSDAFFIAIKDRIRIATLEIKGRRDFMKKRLERLKALNESNRVVNLAELRKRDADNVKRMQSDMEREQGKKSSAEYQILTTSQFKEVGYIKQILRFLQLTTEGHYTLMQEYLNNQMYNTISVNLVQECLSYTMALEKFIDSHTIDVAVQCFETLTEFIQGPCVNNQMDIGRPNLFFAANEMLQMDSNLDKTLPSLDVLKLRTKILVTLLSLLEGNNRNDHVYLLMRKFLNSQNLQAHILHSAAIRSGQKDEQMLIQLTKDWNHAFDNGVELQKTPKEMLIKLKKKYDKFGMLCYFLLNTFKDKKIGENDESDMAVSKWFNQNEIAIEKLRKDTGRIEILRNGQLERVYFTKPELSNNLVDESKQHFLNHVNRETPQTKVFALLDATSEFRVEMEHYEEFKIQESERTTATLRERIDAAAWSFVEKNWDRAQLVMVFYAIMMNIMVCCTFKRTYDSVQNGIPVPGFSQPSFKNPEVSRAKELSPMFAYKRVETAMFFLGLFQMFLATMVFIVYTYFFSAIKVKKLFRLKATETWQDIPYDKRFVRRYIFYSLLDRRLWFFIWYMGVCLIGWAVNPMIYCVLLFEIVVRSSTLRTITKAITSNQNYIRLALTGVLMLFTVFFFSIIYFSFRYKTWITVNGTQDDPQDMHVCDSVWRCIHGFLYWLRDEGFPEGGSLVDSYTTDAVRFFTDMGMVIAVYTIMMEVVFGMVLDAFASLRKEREDTNIAVKQRCYVCDIEKSRFDTKANENISFQDHIKNDHYMWNYLFFLIYLFKKKRTEFTGTEQYIYDLALRTDTSFFPILRSLTLEESELRKLRKRALEKLQRPDDSHKSKKNQDNSDKKSKEKKEKKEKKKMQSTSQDTPSSPTDSSPRSPTFSPDSSFK